MRTIPYLLLAGILLCSVASAKDAQGRWQGFIHNERVDRPYVFDITRDAQGQLVASVIVDTDWGRAGRPEPIAMDGQKIRFTTPFGSNYDGQLSDDGNSMTGTWSLGKRLVPLTMERANRATQWRETPHKTQFVEVEKDVRLEVLDWGGKGRPIVMLAGGGFTAHVFSQFCREAHAALPCLRDHAAWRRRFKRACGTRADIFGSRVQYIRAQAFAEQRL